MHIRATQEVELGLLGVLFVLLCMRITAKLPNRQLLHGSLLGLFFHTNNSCKGPSTPFLMPCPLDHLSSQKTASFFLSFTFLCSFFLGFEFDRYCSFVCFWFLLIACISWSFFLVRCTSFSFFLRSLCRFSRILFSLNHTINNSYRRNWSSFRELQLLLRRGLSFL